jgi:hypothetical protein
MLDDNNVSPDELRDLEQTTLLHVVEASFSRKMSCVVLLLPECVVDPTSGALACAIVDE